MTNQNHSDALNLPIKADVAPCEDDRKNMNDAAKYKETFKWMNGLLHDHIVVMQAAYIEWQHGKGAEAAMQWIANTLSGPGHIPNPDEPYGKEAQAYFDANQANPFPTCLCGRPSNIVWMGQGFCCEAHYKKAKEKYSHGTTDQDAPIVPGVQKEAP